MRVVLYARLSSMDDDKESCDNSLSIKNQIDRLTNWAKKNGYDIVDTIFDDGITGTTANRPGFRRLQNYAKEKLCDIITVTDTSRLARDSLIFLNFVELCRKNSVTIIGLDDSYCSDDSTLPAYLQSSAKQLIDGMFPRLTSEKIRKSCILKAEQGKYMGSKAPYGYRMIGDGKLDICVEEKNVVSLIWELALKGWGAQAIAVELNSHSFYKRSGKPFDYNSVRNILVNPTYKGTLLCRRWSRLRMHVRRTVPKNEGEDVFEHKNTVYAYVSEEEWERVQILRKNRYEDSALCSQNGKSEHRYTGLIYCKECGGKLAHPYMTNGRWAYRCSSHQRGKGCSQHKIYEQDLDDTIMFVVSEFMKGFTPDKNILEKIIHSCTSKKENSQTGSEINSINKRISEIRTKLDNILAQSVSSTLLKEMSEGYSHEYDVLIKKRQMLSDNCSREKEKSIDPDAFNEYINTNKLILNRRALTFLINRITVSERKSKSEQCSIAIEWNI